MEPASKEIRPYQLREGTELDYIGRRQVEYDSSPLGSGSTGNWIAFG
jgi:hypothetical protein